MAGIFQPVEAQTTRSPFTEAAPAVPTKVRNASWIFAAFSHSMTIPIDVNLMERFFNQLTEDVVAASQFVKVISVIETVCIQSLEKIYPKMDSS